jgi:hypothetical protein
MKIIIHILFLQLWLADKLMEINPYKPKLSQVEEPSNASEE